MFIFNPQAAVCHLLLWCLPLYSFHCVSTPLNLLTNCLGVSSIVIGNRINTCHVNLPTSTSRINNMHVYLGSHFVASFNIVDGFGKTKTPPSSSGLWHPGWKNCVFRLFHVLRALGLQTYCEPTKMHSVETKPDLVFSIQSEGFSNPAEIFTPYLNTVFS